MQKKKKNYKEKKKSIEPESEDRSERFAEGSLPLTLKIHPPNI